MDPSCLIALMQVPEFHPKKFFYVPVDRGTVFDDEIDEIRPTLSQLQCLLEKFARAVILKDSRSAILAIVSDNFITQDILDCCRHLSILLKVLLKDLSKPVLRKTYITLFSIILGRMLS
ncbi:hypothetical protein TNCV_328781 [Trichonephila clavipes]|nr:hypothetical protein TNCV_328781 [Trichonephila clavipes]